MNNKELEKMKWDIKYHPFLKHSKIMGYYDMVNLITDESTDYIVRIVITHRYTHKRWGKPINSWTTHISEVLTPNLINYHGTNITVHYITEGIKRIYKEEIEIPLDSLKSDIKYRYRSSYDFEKLEKQWLQLIRQLQDTTRSSILKDIKVHDKIDLDPEFKLSVLYHMEDGDNLLEFTPLKLTVEHLIRFLDLGHLTVPKVVFYKDPDNKTPNTFDFIKVIFSVCRLGEEDFNYESFVREHDKYIRKIVARAIQTSKRYENFGIPINFLKIKSRRLVPGSIVNLEYTLELKDVTK